MAMVASTVDWPAAAATCSCDATAWMGRLLAAALVKDEMLEVSGAAAAAAAALRRAATSSAGDSFLVSTFFSLGNGLWNHVVASAPARSEDS